MRAWIAAAAVVFASTVSGGAQTPAPAASPSPSPSPSPATEATDPDPDSADISLTATVRYRELRMEEPGTAKVEFTGGADAFGTQTALETVWHVDRGTLPRPVPPGTVHRDGAVRLTITTRFADLARLFATAPPESTPVPSASPSPLP